MWRWRSCTRRSQMRISVTLELRTEAWQILDTLWKVEELLPSFGVLEVSAEHGARHRAAVHLLDATHHHTHVPAKTPARQKWVYRASAASALLMSDYGKAAFWATKTQSFLLVFYFLFISLIFVCAAWKQLHIIQIIMMRVVYVCVSTYVASITTATPFGCRASDIPMAICLVRRSWTERSKEIRHYVH